MYLSKLFRASVPSIVMVWTLIIATPVSADQVILQKLASPGGSAGLAISPGGEFYARWDYHSWTLIDLKRWKAKTKSDFDRVRFPESAASLEAVTAEGDLIFTECESFDDDALCFLTRHSYRRKPRILMPLPAGIKSPMAFFHGREPTIKVTSSKGIDFVLVVDKGPRLYRIDDMKVSEITIPFFPSTPPFDFETTHEFVNVGIWSNEKGSVVGSVSSRGKSLNGVTPALEIFNFFLDGGSKVVELKYPGYIGPNSPTYVMGINNKGNILLGKWGLITLFNQQTLKEVWTVRNNFSVGGLRLSPTTNVAFGSNDSELGYAEPVILDGKNSSYFKCAIPPYLARRELHGDELFGPVNEVLFMYGNDRFLVISEKGELVLTMGNLSKRYCVMPRQIESTIAGNCSEAFLKLSETHYRRTKLIAPEVAGSCKISLQINVTTAAGSRFKRIPYREKGRESISIARKGVIKSIPATAEDALASCPLEFTLFPASRLLYPIEVQIEC